MTATAFEFDSVIVSTEVSLVPMEAGANALVTVASASTVNVALAAVPVSATGPVAVGAAVVLLRAPSVDEVDVDVSPRQLAPEARLRR